MDKYWYNFLKKILGDSNKVDFPCAHGNLCKAY